MAFLVPLVLLGVALLLAASSHFASRRRAAKEQAAREVAADRPILIHSINDDRCVGCDACIAVCPTDVLELVGNKAKVLRFGDCIQCEQCMWACPTQALVMHRDDTEPPPIKMPNLDPYYQTDVEGMYLIGEVAGKPLVKNAANAGRAVVEDMRRRGLRAGKSDRNGVDVLIVGSGPAGLSAALTCLHHGLRYVVIEKETVIASTIARYPKGKDVMVEPYEAKNVSFLPVFDARKEDLLPVWQQLFEQVGLSVRTNETVLAIERGQGGFRVKTSEGGYVAQRVVLATGTRGRPRRLGVPGENHERVQSLLEDPALERGRDVLVVGGGDSAVEAAIALCEAGARVTLSYRGDSFSRAQAKNRDQIKALAREEKVTVLLSSRVEAFGAADVSITLGDGRSVTLVNQAAYVLIGADAPVAWLEQLGVKYVMRPHWFALGRTDEVVESLLGNLAASPSDAAGCAALILGQALPVVRAATLKPPPRAVELSPAPRDKKVRPKSLHEAPLVIEATRARKVRHRTHSPEDTRLLRMLRDEGARLADEESHATADRDSVQTRLPGTPHVVPRSRLGSPSGVPSSNVSPVARGAIPLPPPSLAKGSTLDARAGGKLVPPPPSRSGMYPAKRVVDAFDVKTRVADDAQLVALREQSHAAAKDVVPDTEAVLDDILGAGPADDWGGEDHTMIDPNISARFG